MQTQRMEHMPYQDGDSDWRILGRGFESLPPCQGDVIPGLGWQSLDLTQPGLDLCQLIRSCG